MEKSKIIKYVILGVIIVGLIIALFNSYSKINELNNSVSNLQNNLEQNINVMRSDIADIYENVDQRLKKEASILSGYDITYGPLDINNYTTPLFVSVTPKNATESTTVSVKIEETTVNLNRDGEVFSGYIDTNVFIKETTYPLVMVKTGSSVQNEYLEDHDMKSLFTQYMPYLYSDIVIREDSFSNNKIQISNDISVDYKPSSDKNAVTFTQYWLVGENEGVEFFKSDITQKVEGSNGKVFSLKRTYNSAEYQNYENKKWYIVATDSLGFTHKILATCIYHGGNDTASSSIEVEEANDGWGWIYDKDGKLLYGKE